jgi:transcriptional regulator with XRE-family HTH domain
MAHIKSLSPRQLVAGVGQRLKSLRITRRLSQADLATAAGISVRTLRRLESEGDARLETIARVALALRVQHQLDGFFAPEETRTLDELLAAQRRPKRVRSMARR